MTATSTKPEPVFCEPWEAQAFALAMAAKGLFLSSQSAEDFRSAMIRVLEGHVLFPTPRP